MTRLAHGVRDAAGVWHPDRPEDYTPLDVHGIWPWSVLDQSAQAWKTRKAWWDERGPDDLTPRAGRGAMIATGRHGRATGGVSRFDPVLAELLITWYSPPAGRVLDPMAGGPVRGLVAAYLGRDYLGIDISPDQVAANRVRADAWQIDGQRPEWICGDAMEELTRLPDGGFDYALSCPPYWNRERYTDNPRDLSRMRWPEFLDTHAHIIRETVRCLADDRLVSWVISDVRDHRGHLRSLPAHAVAAFEAAGARLTNEQILIEPPGLRAKTTRPPWEAARTTTRRHQIVLTFVKGDRRVAARTIQETPCP